MCWERLFVKINTLTWLVMYKALWTGVRVRRLGLGPGRCPFCYALKDNHIFSGCKRTKEGWMVTWRYMQGFSRDKLKWREIFFACIHDPILKAYRDALVWPFWRTRCLQLYEGKQVPLMTWFTHVLKYYLLALLNLRTKFWNFWAAWTLSLSLHRC